MTPFDKYPEDGLKLLPKVRGDNARHGYGLELQRLTGQTSCAYCGVNLVDDYNHWLLLTVDHVIPAGECKRLGIPDEFRDSFSNTVICCSACNGFDDRYSIPWHEPAGDWPTKRFFDLRPRVFEHRKASILARRAEEIEFFQNRPWESDKEAKT
jgi:hypothetical protein